MAGEQCTRHCTSSRGNDWQKKMKTMAQRAQERGVNRKMTNTIKGPRKGLDWIEVPLYEWFYSDKEKELYRYQSGVFEAYAAKRPTPGLIPTNPREFYSHHHLKVLPPDAVRANVSLPEDLVRADITDSNTYPTSRV